MVSKRAIFVQKCSQRWTLFTIAVHQRVKVTHFVLFKTIDHKNRHFFLEEFVNLTPLNNSKINLKLGSKEGCGHDLNPTF